MNAGVFGIPINGFHPQMTALPNPAAPLQGGCHPSGSSSSRRTATHQSSAFTPAGPTRRVRDRTSSSSPSCHYSPTLPSPPKTAAATDAGNMSLTSRIDAQTKRVVQKLQDDARENDLSRRLERKRRRKESRRHNRRHHSSSSPSDRSNNNMKSYVSQSSGSFGDDGSKVADCSGSSLCSSNFFESSTSSSSSLSSSNKKRRFAFEKKADDNNKSFPSTGGVSCTSSLSGFDESEKGFVSEGNSASAAPDHTFLDLYSDVFLASEKPQFMATLGGRIVSWNDEFLSTSSVTKTQLRGCMTVHNLIDERCHYVLNDLFELALRGGSDQDGGCAKSNEVAKSPTPPPPPLIVIADRGDPPAGAGGAGGHRGRGLGDMRRNMELRQQQVESAPALGGGGPGRQMSTAVPSVMARSDSLPLSDLSDGVDDAERVATAATEGVGESSSSSSSSSSCVDEQQSSELMYSSVTLPCIQFPNSTVPLYMTIVLMNDFDPSKRCFYCVMAPIQMQQLTPYAATGNPLLSSGGPGLALANDAYQRVGNELHSALLAAQNGTAMASMASSAQSSPRTKLGVIHRISQDTLASLL